MKRIVVTGAGGFLGSKILSQGQSQDMVAVSGRNIEPASNIAVLRRETFWESFGFSGEDVLINCAFPTNAAGTQMADGLKFTKRLMKKAASEGAGAVINISSQSVYGQSRIAPADEKTRLNPESGYAIGKYAAELLTNSLCEGIPHTNLRMASLIGPGFDLRVVNKMIKRVVHGNGLNVKDSLRRFGFFDVRDAADAILKLAQGNADDWDDTYVLGSERSYRLTEIAEAVRAAYLRYNPVGFQIEITESGEIGDTGLDSSLLYRRLQWKPKYSLQDSVDEIMRSEMEKALNPHREDFKG